MRWHELGVRLAVVTRPLSLDELCGGERAVWDRLAGSGRRRDWLLGRAALKRLLGPVDTSGVSFPHCCLSLSHAGGVAVAVVAPPAHPGVGVDFEPWRTVDHRMARFFLHPDERVDDQLLRLWTVKEALLKATPANEAAQLLDYRLDDPAADAGTAVDGRGHRFRYACSTLMSGPVSVAICLGRDDAPV